VQFKNVHITGRPDTEGGVEVISGGLRVRADSIDYDPAKHRLYVRATGRNRVRQFDPNTGLETALFDEFVYDTQANQIISSKGFMMIHRK
jgi:hypothetical protein